jgi:F-type H+-transporting ATPase subunit a
MEHPYLFFVKIFEAIGLGHFAHTYPHVVYSWVLMAILIIAGALATKTISMIPGKTQNLWEVIVSGIEEFMVETAGEESRWLFPLAATVFIYVFIGNLIGIIPGFLPPTANLNTTVIEVIGHLARILSLSFRLFGNMMGHEIVLAILFGLAGAFFAPLPIMALGIFVAFVQGFVFFLLSIIYFSGAMEHAH